MNDTKQRMHIIEIRVKILNITFHLSILIILIEYTRLYTFKIKMCKTLQEVQEIKEEILTRVRFLVELGIPVNGGLR